MTRVANPTGNGRFALSGAIAGVVSTLAFTIIHDIFISDIWFSLVIMLVAGALCGGCVSWSYGLLVAEPSWKNWLGYNLWYVGMFVLLGFISVLLFEPVVSMAALVATNAPPDELIGQALPITAVFTLLMAVVVCLLYGFSWSRFVVVLITCTVLVLLLGLNVSVIGLVSIPRGSWVLVMEMYGLIVALNVVYAVVFVGLERKILFQVSLHEQKVMI